MIYFGDVGKAYVAALEAHGRAITHPRAAETDPGVLAAVALDEAARELARTCAAFAPALGASNRGHTLVPLAADGSAPLPGATPARDLRTLLDYWAQWPDAVAGVVTADSGLVAASVDADGWAWLRQAATVAAAPADDDRDDRPAYLLDHGGAALRLVEWVAPVGPTRSLAFFGTAGMKAATDAFGPKAGPKIRDGLLWDAPPAWELPRGRRARGIRLLDVVPADGAVILADGRRWTAHWPTRPGTLPDWLAADVLGGRVRVSA